MGSNMMRQAVPLLKPESPLVGTGIESDVALDSGVTIVAKRDGFVDKIDGKRIVVKVTEEKDFTKSSVDIYNLQKFKRSNQYLVPLGFLLDKFFRNELGGHL